MHKGGLSPHSFHFIYFSEDFTSTVRFHNSLYEERGVSFYRYVIDQEPQNVRNFTMYFPGESSQQTTFNEPSFLSSESFHNNMYRVEINPYLVWTQVTTTSQPLLMLILYDLSERNGSQEKYTARSGIYCVFSSTRQIDGFFVTLTDTNTRLCRTSICGFLSLSNQLETFCYKNVTIKINIKIISDSDQNKAEQTSAKQ